MPDENGQDIAAEDVQAEAEEVKEAIDAGQPDEAKQHVDALVARLEKVEAELAELKAGHEGHVNGDHPSKLPWLESIDKDGQAMEDAERAPLHSHRAYRKVL